MCKLLYVHMCCCIYVCVCFALFVRVREGESGCVSVCASVYASSCWCVCAIVNLSVCIGNWCFLLPFNLFVLLFDSTSCVCVCVCVSDSFCV